MYLMRNHDVWIYVRCANSDPRIAFDRCMTLSTKQQGMDSLYAAHLLTIAAAIP